jgi:hypothetical protein
MPPLFQTEAPELRLAEPFASLAAVIDLKTLDSGLRSLERAIT